MKATTFGGIDSSDGLPNDSYPYTGFLGLVTDTPFSSIKFTSSFGDPDSYVIDDLTFATPEPGALAMAGLGLVGLCLFGRFKRK